MCINGKKLTAKWFSACSCTLLTRAHTQGASLKWKTNSILFFFFFTGDSNKSVFHSRGTETLWIPKGSEEVKFNWANHLQLIPYGRSLVNVLQLSWHPNFFAYFHLHSSLPVHLEQFKLECLPVSLLWTLFYKSVLSELYSLLPFKNLLVRELV